MINYRKILYLKKKSTLFLICLSFILGFLYRHSNPNYLFYYKNKFEKKLQEISKPDDFKNSSNEICPKKISRIPKNSTLIIGHAYGSHIKSDLRGNVGIAPKVYDFYLKNKNNIESIIFSGDVLKEPSIKKWKNFYSKFKGDINIFIAPGNHDIGGKDFDSAYRDVFNLIPHKNQAGLDFPFKFIFNNSLFIIGDSNSKENSIEEIISIIEEEKKYQNIYVVIHHAFPEGLRDSSNAPGKHDFIKDSFFKDKFKDINSKKIYFLYGDGGAFKEKPRFKCIKLGNSNHIISGIGELPGDTILVISNNNLFRIEI